MTDMAELSKVLRYDPESGNFYWKNQWSRSGKLAGDPHNMGYWNIRVKGKAYLAHRLAWFFVYGKWPVNIIDHRDRNKRNNRIENLRDTNQSINQYNQKIRNNSASGYKGVTLHQGRWKVRRSGKYIGMFGTPEEAAAAYEAHNV